METKSTLSTGSIVGLGAIVLVLMAWHASYGQQCQAHDGYQLSQTGQTHLDLHSLARQDATDNGISADLFERQINQESGFNPDAISPAGAIGISQFMPAQLPDLALTHMIPLLACQELLA